MTLVPTNNNTIIRITNKSISPQHLRITQNLYQAQLQLQSSINLLMRHNQATLVTNNNSKLRLPYWMEKPNLRCSTLFRSKRAWAATILTQLRDLMPQVSLLSASADTTYSTSSVKSSFWSSQDCLCHHFHLNKSRVKLKSLPCWRDSSS